MIFLNYPIQMTIYCYIAKVIIVLINITTITITIIITMLLIIFRNNNWTLFKRKCCREWNCFSIDVRLDWAILSFRKPFSMFKWTIIHWNLSSRGRISLILWEKIILDFGILLTRYCFSKELLGPFDLYFYYNL
jgi:hypothetical protein